MTLSQKRPGSRPFHTYDDSDVIFEAVAELGEKRWRQIHRVIQERDMAYRFYPHLHPYVGNLTRRLLRETIRGLQAADTEYAPGETLPDSVEVSLAQGVTQDLPAGSPVALLTDVQAQLPNGNSVSLGDGMQLELNATAQVKLAGPMNVTVRAGLAGLPEPGQKVTLTTAQPAVIELDAEVALTGASAIRLYDGGTATLPNGTRLLALRGTPLTVPSGREVTHVRSKPQPKLFEAIFSAARYDPSPTLVKTPYPVKDLDFTYSGAYSVYNWELFFHVPLAIATHLSRNHRFAEAQHWLHYLFDPTDDSDGPTPERFWKVRPFQYTEVRKIEEILVNLSTGSDPELREETILSIEAWKDAPFRPHVIARYRQQAYMYKTAMTYLDNLIAWGDSLFRQDTGEAVDEALMVYVMAANILGPRPQAVPRKGSVRSQTYANLRSDLDKFGNAMRDLEPEVPFDLMPFPGEAPAEEERLATLRSLGKALYFGVPRNDKLMSYWDTISDRLFKIHNSLNIQGIFRRLALFEPPIDPAMLARAAAAGLDVGAIVNGLNQPLPLVRFQVLVRSALEVIQEAKALGNSLLAAMEKEDGEAMVLLRTKHESALLKMVEQVRYAQLQEAVKSRESLLRSIASSVQRYTFYERQLGKTEAEVQSAIPTLVELDRSALEKMRLSQDEPEVPLREIEFDIAEELGAAGGKIVSSHEAEAMSKAELARNIQDTVKALNLLAQGLSLIPDFKIDLHYWGLGGSSDISGGSKLSQVARFGANVALAIADRFQYESQRAEKVAGFARREQEWAYQSSLAAAEISQIYKQVRAAEIRQAIAEYELRNHRQQMLQAAEVEAFLNAEGTQKDGKKTNKALYAWMKREIKGLYGQVFQFAFDIARQAERALQHELGNPELRFVDYGYLAGKEGLLAGEKLHLDIKRMEMAYVMQLNQRELELSKAVSVMQVDPLALVQLRETGSCTVRIPEVVFDLDGPGHYFRRIKSVAVTVPSVAGPYSSVNCTLTLQKSSIRKSPVLGDGYERADAEDPRFDDYFGSLQSVVTSSGQNDSGTFDVNLRDERYLPFENYGAVSEWRLELPANPSDDDPRTFDYRTISDVVLHIRFTARQAGDPLRSAATASVKQLIQDANAAGSLRLFSVRQEFPSEWARFKAQTPPAGDRFELTLQLRPEHYPFWGQGRLTTVDGLHVLVRPSGGGNSMDIFDKVRNEGQVKQDLLVKDKQSYGNLLVGSFENIAKPASPTGELKVFFPTKAIDDLWVAVRWSG